MERKLYAEWVVFGVVLPVGMVLVSYLLSVMLDLNHPFLIVFGSAELLLVAVLFLIPVLLDVDKTDANDQLSPYRKPFLIVAIVFASAFYATLRTFSLKLLHPYMDPTVITPITVIAIFSVTATLVCGLYAVLVRYEVMTIALTGEN
jgi:hypothetical protein